MKPSSRFLLLAATAGLHLAALHAQPTTSLDPDSPLTDSTSFTIRFPGPMVAPEGIDVDDTPSPISVHPDLDSDFIWLSQTQGLWKALGPIRPGETYQFALRLKTMDLTGDVIPNWKAQLTAPPLTVDEYYGDRINLSARPQIPLEFNYPIRLADAAEHIWIQDRSTRERFPVEILLNRATNDLTGDVVDVSDESIPPPTEFRIRPRDPLPVGRSYDLIVDSPVDAFAGATLPYPRVFPLGTTRPLTVDFVAARHWPKHPPFIEIKFTPPLDDDQSLPPDAITLDPPVTNLQVRQEGEFITLEGDFDPATRYRVTIAPSVTGNRGYPLAAASVWGATFPEKTGTLFFPATTLRQRASLGLRFAFLQSNTGPVTWKLAAIPLEKLHTVQQRLAQLTDERPPADLITKLELPVLTEDTFPATTDTILRSIEWPIRKSKIENRESLPTLLQAETTDPTGTLVRNSALVLFSDTVFTRKDSPDVATLRLADMATGQPRRDVPVRLVTRDLTEIATATTDSQGTVTFPQFDLLGAAYFLADTPDGLAVNLVDPGPAFPSGNPTRYSAEPTYLGTIIPDRPLYRPGHEIKFKGFVRTATDLAIPADRTVTWEILSGYQGDVVESGTTTVNEFGGWDAAWTIPERGKLGDFRIQANVDAIPVGDPGSFQVEEYRNPAFSVIAEPIESADPGTATVTVASQYFHGAPNVGSVVQWTATWTSDHDGEYYYSDDGYNQVDVYSEHRPIPSYSAQLTGETTLDADGRATLTTSAPFADPGNRAHANVYWEIDVTGPDGQTISGGTSQDVTLNPITLGVRVNEPTADEKQIAFDLRAVPFKKDGPLPDKIATTLYLVSTKSVKERVAPFVYQYRNTDVFTVVEQRTAAPGDHLTFTLDQPGRYVLVAAPLPGEPGIPVSADVTLTGPGEAEMPIESDQSLTLDLQLDSPSVDDAGLTIGDTAHFTVLAPSPGIAWVTVETDRILDTFTIPIDGNAARIDLPLKPEYAPNAVLSVYLLRPGKTDDLPGEMFGFESFSVSDPSKKLTLALTTDAPEYQPRDTIQGTVTVTSEGTPVANAELTLAAVDDSVLELGNWFLPELLPSFYPSRNYQIATYRGLDGYVANVTEESLTQKGFIIGGGGKDDFGNTDFVRKDFRPRILWLPNVTTDAEGRATFETEAPDNLTRFRLIALGQTKANQFGSNSATFTVTKDLLIEPALPRFLREGDRIDLRATVRQKTTDSAPVTLTAQAEGLTLTGPSEVSLTAKKDVPTTATFPASIPSQQLSTHDSQLKTASITFTAKATESDLDDSIATTLPILPATITVRESLAGNWQAPTFDPDTPWTVGTADLTLSTSPYLTKLLGIPQILDYPHGCFEQKSARLLAITHLTKLLAYLPTPESRTANYEAVITRTLDDLAASLLPDNTLPYWPNGTETSTYATIQSAWAVADATAAGIEIPERLAFALPHALDQMINRETRITVDPTLRTFALFARAQFGKTPELTAAAEELFLQRDRLSVEARALLALTCHQLKIFPDHQKSLVAALPDESPDRPFDPRTFSSPTRSEAITTWARLVIEPDLDPARLNERLQTLLASSTALSTQENLWLLVAFNALLEARPPTNFAANPQPAPDARAANDSASAWTDLDLATLTNWTIQGLTGSGTYVLAATRPLGPNETDPVSAGMTLDRVVRNLTDPTRTGTPDAPFHLADQLLITYRIFCDTDESYVALEDALPAGFEIVNPNLSMFGRTYDISTDADTAALSYSELRDAQTNLYFDHLPKGASNTAVLARATAAGTFTWPATQIAPMYDARHRARTAPSTCTVTAD